MRAMILLLVVSASACGSKVSPAARPPPLTAASPAANGNPVIANATIAPNFGIDSLTLFSFAATASIPDGDPMTYTWRFANGTVFHDGQAVSTQLVGTTCDGSSNLTVTDSRGGVATTSTNRFVLASMTNDWILRSPSFPGAYFLSAFSLNQDRFGAITGSVSGGGRPIGGAPSRIENSGRVEIRFKLGNDVDVTVVGQMQQSGDEIVGTFTQSNATFNGRSLKGLTAVLSLRYPRPTNGIFVAITVMNCTFASSGRLAM